MDYWFIICFDSLRLHCASNFKKENIERKLGLSIFTNPGPSNMELVISELHSKNPPWTLRNKLIAEHLEPKQLVIDIGGGAGDILKYYKLSKYCNIDGMPVDNVDIVLDLDPDYHLELEEGWDYSKLTVEY